MAGDFEKPNKVHTLFPEEMQTKFWPLPIRDLFLVGSATERKLKFMGIYTIGDLARADVKILKKRLGKHGETIWHFANGRNADAVTPEPAENKGYGNSTTTAHDVTSKEEAAQVFLSLCETVGMRLRRDPAGPGPPEYPRSSRCAPGSPAYGGCPHGRAHTCRRTRSE